jgi:hypothetical protein
MTTKAEAPHAGLTLINLLGAPKRIHNAAEYRSEAMQQIYKTHYHTYDDNRIHTICEWQS